MHHDHNYNHYPTTVSNNTLHRQPQTLGIAPNVLAFEEPSETTLDSGIVVLDIKPKKPKSTYRISRPVSHNPEITEINIYTEQLSLGGAWQGEIIAPINTVDTTPGTATHYRVKNIWLALIRHQLERNTKTKTYTFRIQSAFMVSLPKIVYLYQQNSLIVINENMAKCNM